jgi:hypothetical protein
VPVKHTLTIEPLAREATIDPPVRIARRKRNGVSRTTAPRRSPHRSRDGGFPEHELSEGWPMPREPAYAVKRSQDGEAQAASE